MFPLMKSMPVALVTQTMPLVALTPLLVLMLGGPVLHHTLRTGELARLIIVADASMPVEVKAIE